MKDLKKLQGYVKKMALLWRLRDPDDVVQEVVCSILEGKHQKATARQIMIDYLRVNVIDHRVAHSEVKAALKNPSFEADLEHIAGVEVPSHDERIDLKNYLSTLAHRDLEIVKLYLLGFSLREIGQRFGVTESGISIRLRQLVWQAKKWWRC